MNAPTLIICMLLLQTILMKLTVQRQGVFSEMGNIYKVLNQGAYMTHLNSL